MSRWLLLVLIDPIIDIDVLVAASSLVNKITTDKMIYNVRIISKA